MVLNVDAGHQPRYVYFGSRLSDYDLAHLQQPRGGRMDAYPAYGLNCPAEAALAMRHADGNMSTSLVATGVERQADVTRMQNLTRRLSDDYLDLDLLDERAREVLGLLRADEILLR